MEERCWKSPVSARSPVNESGGARVVCIFPTAGVGGPKFLTCTLRRHGPPIWDSLQTRKEHSKDSSKSGHKAQRKSTLQALSGFLQGDPRAENEDHSLYFHVSPLVPSVGLCLLQGPKVDDCRGHLAHLGNGKEAAFGKRSQCARHFSKLLTRIAAFSPHNSFMK